MRVIFSSLPSPSCKQWEQEVLLISLINIYFFSDERAATVFRLRCKSELFLHHRIPWCGVSAFGKAYSALETTCRTVLGRCPAVLMSTCMSSTAPMSSQRRVALVNRGVFRDIPLREPSKIFFFSLQSGFWTGPWAQKHNALANMLLVGMSFHCSLDLKCHLLH